MTYDYKFHLAGRNDSLEARKKRSCPHCGRKTFVLYIDAETGLPLHESVGKCDRADKCAWHYTPRQYFADNNIHCDKGRNYPPAGRYGQQSPQKPPRTEPKASYMDMGMVERTLRSYDRNNFVLWLRDEVGADAANEVLRRYRVGTAKDGGTIFWQIDGEGIIRAGKIMLYDRQTGHRIKDKVDGQYPITWVHSILKLPDYNLRQCLFGLHLLNDSTAPVAIAEAEKTALVASIYMPEYVWMATGGKQNFGLIEEAAGQLQGRKVILFPDLGATADWEAKANELRSKYKLDISVYKYLERIATEQERADGLDIADYLLRNAPPKATAAPQPATLTATPAIERLQPDTIKSAAEQETPAEGKETTQNRVAECLPKTQGGWYMKTFAPVWDAEIRELEMFFDSRKDHLPDSVKTGHSVIVNVPLFIESHLARVNSHNGNPTFQPYLDRLIALKNLLTN